MRKLVVTEYVTIDGVMEAPNLWSFDFWSDDAAEFKNQELKDSDIQLMGRVTYDGFSQAWPKMEAETGDFGVKMNSMRKYVVSTTLQTAEWNNTTIIKENVVEEIRKLKTEANADSTPLGNILVPASSGLLPLLFQNKLIDEFRYLLHPIVFGKGKKLFPEGKEFLKTSFKLKEAKGFSKGIIVLIYEPIQ